MQRVFSPPNAPRSFAAALFPLYRPVKVVPADPVEGVPPRSPNLDYGRPVQRAEALRRHAKGRFINQPTNLDDLHRTV